jgi:nickel transport protein
MNLRALPWLLAGGMLLMAGGGVHAHGIESSLERLGPLTNGKAFERPRNAGTSLQLESRFSSGVPASDAAVKLVPPDGGTPIDLGRTDADGRLTFALPRGARPDWEVQVDAGPGHRDYLELPTAPGASHARRSDGPHLPRLMAVEPGVVALGLLSVIGAAPLLRRRR